MTHKELIISEKELINAIDTFNIQDTRIAIIGGHYILLYEKKSDSLKPAVYQEFEDWGNKTFAKKNTFDFPIKSFVLTVKLFVHFNYRNIKSKCVLLVNDDSLFKRNFRDHYHYESVKDRGLELRKKYFSTDNNIPFSFKRILKEYNIKIKDFFAKFENLHWTQDSILPRETIFVSERRLCRKFKKTVKGAANDDQLFKILKINETGVDNIDELMVESNKINSVCLIEKGICNCGGKAFQFYYDLINQGYETIIFFVPNECKEQVKEGTDLICNSKTFKKKPLHIINITNIESNPDEPVLEKEISVEYYSNHLKFEK